MKKTFIFLLLYISSINLFSQEYYLKVTKKSYTNNVNDNLDNEKGLFSITSYEIKYDNKGYIKEYTSAYKNPKHDFIKDIYYKVTDIDDDTKQVYTYLYYSDDEIYEYTEQYKYSNNQWITYFNDCPYIGEYNNNSILYKNDNMVECSLEITDGKLKLFFSDCNYSLCVKDGIFENIINDTMYENHLQSSVDFANEYAIGKISKENSKYIIESQFNNTFDVYIIETNYNFVSWKAAAFNLVINHWEVAIIPYALGFGNGFEFKEGVDYSGENEEPLKKNDETVEVVQPENTNNNKPIIYAVSTLIIIILASVLIIVFKKKKNH